MHLCAIAVHSSEALMCPTHAALITVRQHNRVNRADIAIRTDAGETSRIAVLIRARLPWTVRPPRGSLKFLATPLARRRARPTI